MQYVMRELLTVPTIRVEIIVRTNVIATASFVDKEAINLILKSNNISKGRTDQGGGGCEMHS